MHGVFEKYLKTLRDSSTVKVLVDALSAQDFALRLRFVLWFSVEWTSLESWGSSCPCHQEEWSAGESISCNFHGRLLAIAYDYATSKFKDILQEALSWTPVTWDGDVEFWTDAVGVVRSTIARAHLKIGFLDRVPFIFGKLGFDPEVRARIYTQWEAVPVSQHHRRTIKFMEEGGELRAAIDAMETPTDLSNITLKRSVLAIRELPFNDETNEAPHAHFSRVHQHCPSSTFAWKSASTRMHQNLKDAYNLSAAADQDLQYHYNTFRQVVQSRPRKRDRRMSRARFEAKLYRCADKFTVAASSPGGIDDES